VAGGDALKGSQDLTLLAARVKENKIWHRNSYWI
jgi:hypothetical protein